MIRGWHFGTEVLKGPFVAIIKSLCVFLILSSCGQGQADVKKSLDSSSSKTETSQDDIKSDRAPKTDKEIRYELIDAPDATFGYQIIIDERVVIHQPNIPGMPGLKGFSEKEGAVKVAELVVRKLKNGEMPPTVSVDELNALGVLE